MAEFNKKTSDRVAENMSAAAEQTVAVQSKASASVDDAAKMYTYLRGFATGGKMHETLKALPFARAAHKDQRRKSGEPYILHPEKMACEAISLGLAEDPILATIMLHDVVEDCGIRIEDLPVNDIVKRGVQLMTFEVREGETKEAATARYYDALIQSREATLCKIIDRTHNVSTMSGVFTGQKLSAYIAETRTYVLPLIKRAKEVYPEDANTIFALKFHITSVIDSLEAMISHSTLYFKEDNKS